MSSTAYLAFFFFNDTATTEIYTLSLHDALPILLVGPLAAEAAAVPGTRFAFGSRFGSPDGVVPSEAGAWTDRKSTRLNSSHGYISYAVFCLKKKNTTYSAPLPTSHPTPSQTGRV